MQGLVTTDGVAIYPGSARALACWLRRLAATDFREKNFAPAWRQRRHAGARALPETKRAAR
jgi:hypothetical protein